jgi:hypothetical protein
MDRTVELKAKIERLRKRNTALLAQSRLIQNLVALVKSSASDQVLTSTLQKAVPPEARKRRCACIRDPVNWGVMQRRGSRYEKDNPWDNWNSGNPNHNFLSPIGPH